MAISLGIYPTFSDKPIYKSWSNRDNIYPTWKTIRSFCHKFLRSQQGGGPASAPSAVSVRSVCGSATGQISRDPEVWKVCPRAGPQGAAKAWGFEGFGMRICPDLSWLIPYLYGFIHIYIYSMYIYIYEMNGKYDVHMCSLSAFVPPCGIPHVDDQDNTGGWWAWPSLANHSCTQHWLNISENIMGIAMDSSWCSW